MARGAGSRLGAFGFGLGAAAVITAGALAAHNYFAPPSPDAEPTISGSIAGFAASAGAVAERFASGLAPRGRAGSLPEPEIVPTEPVPSSASPSMPSAERVERAAAKPDATTVADKLTRNIQAELQRVGCYGGAVNGYWDDATRTAMTAFNTNVRIQLKVNGPDYILLTLLQGHGARACTRPCEAGNVASCEAGSISAQNAPAKADRPAATMATAPVRKARATVTAASQTKDDPAPAPKPAWRTTVVTAQPVPVPPLPAQRPGTPRAVTPEPVVTASAPIAPPPAPLPGRMAMGGPAAAPHVATAPRVVAAQPPHQRAAIADAVPVAALDPAAAQQPRPSAKAAPRLRPTPRARPDSPRDVFSRLNMSAP